MTSAPPPCAYLIVTTQFIILLFQIFFPKSFSLLERYVQLRFWYCPTNCWSAWHSRWKGVSCISRIVPSCSKDMFTVIIISDACCAEHTFFIAWWSYKIIGMYYFPVTIYLYNNSQSRWDWTVNCKGNLKHLFWLLTMCWSKSINSAIHLTQKQFIVHIKHSFHQQHATLHDTSRTHTWHIHM